MFSRLPALTAEQMSAGIRRRLIELQAMSFEQLCRLPASEGQDVDVGPRLASVWTYVDQLSPDEVRIVVQLSAERSPNSAWSQVDAEGFRRRRDGTEVAVVPPEIYEFK